jgi:hypothetical protein
MNYDVAIKYLNDNVASLSEEDQDNLSEIISALDQNPNDKDYQNLVIETANDLAQKNGVVLQGSSEDLASNSPMTATEEGVPWEDYVQQEKDRKYNETIDSLVSKGFTREEAIQNLATMPRSMSSMASGKNPSTMGVVSNLLQDYGGGAGRVVGSGYDAIVNGQDFHQSMSDVSGDNGVQEFLRSPMTPVSMAFGGLANPIGKFGVSQLQKIKGILPKNSMSELVGIGVLGGGTLGLTDYGLQKGSQALTNLSGGEFTKREMPSVGQGLKESLLSALTGGLLGGGANYILNKPMQQTFKANETPEMVNATLNKIYPNAENASTRSNLSEDIIRKQSGLSSEFTSSPEFSNQLVRQYATKTDDINKINAYNKEITENPLGSFSLLERRGSNWLKRYIDEVEDLKTRAGQGMGAIEEGKLGKTPVASQTEVMSAWSKLLTDDVGLKPQFSKDGILISLKKLDNSIVDESDPLYSKIFKQTETILKDSKNGMSGDALRGLEKRLRLKKETIAETGQTQKYEQAMGQFQKFTKEKVFEALRKNGATKEELEQYQKHRQDFYDWSKQQDDFKSTAGKELELPSDFADSREEIYKNSGVFMNRLVNTLGHGQARNIGDMMKKVLGEDPFADAVHVKLAMEMANLGSQSGGGILKSDKFISNLANKFKSQPDVTNKTADLVSEMAKSKRKDVNVNLGSSKIPKSTSGLGNIFNEKSKSDSLSTFNALKGKK